MTGLCIAAGEMIPNGYGVAYHEYERDVAVCYPIPVNLVVGLWRVILVRLKIGFGHNAVARAYDRGHRDGARQLKDRIEEII